MEITQFESEDVIITSSEGQGGSGDTVDDSEG